MKKQTAVDWLESLYYPEYIPKHIFEQAKEMEKQQIIDACNQTDVIGKDHEQPGEQYYNETYGGKK